MCLAQGHNTVTPVRLQPAAPRSGVKHSTTEPLRSLVHIISLVVTTLLESAKGRRMAVEIISRSIFVKVWDRAGIELVTPGTAVSHVTDCAMWLCVWFEALHPSQQLWSCRNGQFT